MLDVFLHDAILSIAKKNKMIFEFFFMLLFLDMLIKKCFAIISIDNIVVNCDFYFLNFIRSKQSGTEKLYFLTKQLRNTVSCVTKPKRKVVKNGS